jgi:membrane protein YqaA with SNARE-associated domain
MVEPLHTVVVFLVIFLIVFLLNVIPIFAPPTWTVLSFVAIRFKPNVIVLALVGAAAATLGRLLLSKLSTVIVRQKFLSEGARKNIDALKVRLETNQKLSFAVFLFYAFSPLPSNHLFIAYGLTALRLKLIAVPFLIGRVVSYAFWAFTASKVAQILSYESVTAESFFSYYFIASQLFGLFAVYVFTKIDWQRLFDEKKLRWRR